MSQRELKFKLHFVTLAHGFADLSIGPLRLYPLHCASYH